MNKGTKIFIFVIILLPIALLIDTYRSNNNAIIERENPEDVKKVTIEKQREAEKYKKDSIYEYKKIEADKISNLRNAGTAILQSRWTDGHIRYNDIVEIEDGRDIITFHISTVTIKNDGKNIIAFCSSQCIKRTIDRDNTRNELLNSWVLCGASTASHKIFSEYKRMVEEKVLNN